MKKLNLKGLSQVLSEKELKQVIGGSTGGSSSCSVCSGSCTAVGKLGTCYNYSFGCACKV